MKMKLIAVALTGTLAIVSGAASAKGCLTGAAVGGVAGHVAGGHGVLGAAAGCAIGHHREKVKARDARAANATNTTNARTSTPNSTTTPVAGRTMNEQRTGK